MKKILFIIAVFISSISFSQQGAQTTYTVTSIANMKIYSGVSSRVHVTATNEDYVNCPACTPDEVTIYDGAGSRVWKLTPEPGVLSSTYFDGIGTVGDPIVPLIDAAPTDASVLPVTSNGVFDGLAGKQATLVSGTNIKTVNSTSLLGSGDIVVSGGGSTLSPIGIGTLSPAAGYMLHLSSATATTQMRYTNTSGNFNYAAIGTDFYYTNGTAGRHIFANGPGNFRFVVHTDGRIFGDAIHNNGGDLTGATNHYIASGTFTPTLTNTTNVAASTAYLSQWIRVGNVITVTGKVDIDVTSAAATELNISLPIASLLANEQNLAGTANSAAAAALSAAIRADATNDRAAVVFVATSLTNDSYFFTFTYTVL